MRRATAGELIFWGTCALALPLYLLTAPDGLPWESPLLNLKPSTFYLFLREIFGGSRVLLSCVAAAISGGLLGTMANRHFGWRVGLAAAISFVVSPWVWYRAISGGREILLLLGVVFAAWVLNAVLVLLFTVGLNRKVKSDPSSVVSWTLLVLALGFAAFSATTHEYRYGEAASAYAQAIVEEAGNRIIILNGIADEQIMERFEKFEPFERFEKLNLHCQPQPPTSTSQTSFLRLTNDEASRAKVMEMVKREWPNATNLHFAAQISVAAFVREAVRMFPDRFYAMNGMSTTADRWAKRWEKMAPYVDTGDPFIPAMRRAFAFEGNYLANRMIEDESDGIFKQLNKIAAWNLYACVFEKIEPGNLAAAVNMGEMMHRGYPVDEQTRSRIIGAMTELCRRVSGDRRITRAAALVSAYGPVVRDDKVADEMGELAERARQGAKQSGTRRNITEELRSIVALNNQMIEQYNIGSVDEAAVIARAILSRPEGEGFKPAYAVLGAATAKEGDYVASEHFYRLALTDADPWRTRVMVLNDYADTLRHLRRFREAEECARRAIIEASGKGRGNGVWALKMTLAQILRDAGKSENEVRNLIAEIMKSAPPEMHPMIRRELAP